MMDSHSVDTQKAIDYIYELSSEIGPRPAGSEQVQQSFKRIRGWLADKGYAFEEQGFQFAPYAKFIPYYSVIALFLLIAVWTITWLPFLTIPLPFLIGALPELWQAYNRKRKRTEPAKNLFVSPEGVAAKDLDLILCAHIDTARQNPVRSKFGRNVQDNLFVMMQRISWMLLFFALFLWGGFGLNPIIVTAVSLFITAFALLVIGVDLWEQLAHKDRYVPGAHDNASGVALLLVLAELIKDNPEINSTVGFLFTDAEETGMHGADAFAKQMAKEGINVPVVVLDQVGAGKTIRIVRGVGRFKPLKTDPELNRLLDRVAPDALDLYYVYRNGDFSSFLRAGIPAISLETTGSGAAKSAYHRPEDRYRIIQPETIERMIHLMVAFLREFEKTKKVNNTADE